MGKLTEKNTFISIKDANIKNKTYITKHEQPTFKFNLNLFTNRAVYKPTSDESSEHTEYDNPEEFMEICEVIFFY